MNIAEIADTWAKGHPGCFRITVDRWRALGSYPWSAFMEEGLRLDFDLEGVCVCAIGERPQEDEPALLSIWLALDRSCAFRIHSPGCSCSGDWAHLPLEFADDRNGVIDLLDNAVADFCSSFAIEQSNLRPPADE